jgi:hypothetical protein
MIITKETLKQFNDINKKTIEKMSYSDSLRLNGSYSISLWASDIDLYQKMNSNKLDGLLYYLIKNIINLTYEFQFIKIKIGDNKYKTVVSALDILQSQEKVERLLNNAVFKWIKWDLFVFNGSYIDEISIIYDFTTESDLRKIDFKTLIENDIKKYSKKNKYKALKRMRILKPNDKYIQKQLQNNYNGFMYLTKSRLESLKKSKFDMNVKKLVLSNLKEDIIIKIGAQFPSLRNLKTLKMSEIPKMIKKLQNLINKNVDLP